MMPQVKYSVPDLTHSQNASTIEVLHKTFVSCTLTPKVYMFSLGSEIQNNVPSVSDKDI